MPYNTGWDQKWKLIRAIANSNYVHMKCTEEPKKLKLIIHTIGTFTLCAHTHKLCFLLIEFFNVFFCSLLYRSVELCFKKLCNVRFFSYLFLLFHDDKHFDLMM